MWRQGGTMTIPVSGRRPAVCYGLWHLLPPPIQPAPTCERMLAACMLLQPCLLNPDHNNTLVQHATTRHMLLQRWGAVRGPPLGTR